jgi:hypothetical protein
MQHVAQNISATPHPQMQHNPNPKSNAPTNSLVVPQKPPHPHKEKTRRSQTGGFDSS